MGSTGQEVGGGIDGHEPPPEEEDVPKIRLDSEPVSRKANRFSKPSSGRLSDLVDDNSLYLGTNGDAEMLSKEKTVEDVVAALKTAMHAAIAADINIEVIHDKVNNCYNAIRNDPDNPDNKIVLASTKIDAASCLMTISLDVANLLKPENAGVADGLKDFIKDRKFLVKSCQSPEDAKKLIEKFGAANLEFDLKPESIKKHQAEYDELQKNHGLKIYDPHSNPKHRL